MTAEQHEFIYNIGMSMAHGNSTNLHLCPNKRDYEYFTYWSKVCTGVKFGAAVGQNKIQMYRRTGEEAVLLEEEVPLCPRLTQRVKMVSDLAARDSDCDRFIEDLGLGLAESIWKVAVEKTLVLKVNCDEWEIPMIDFVGAFDPRALISQFRSLFLCLLKEVNSSGNRKCILNRMTALFRHLESIYDAKDEVLEQVKDYMGMAQRGIEATGMLPPDLRLLKSNIINELDRKNSTGDCMQFLFAQSADQKRFQEGISVLKAFLEAYVETEAKGLLIYLQKYSLDGLQINSIRMLSKIDLTSMKAKPANIKLLESYLANPIDNSKEALFINIA